LSGRESGKGIVLITLKDGSFVPGETLSAAVPDDDQPTATSVAKKLIRKFISLPF
jgi:hypothetical protein